MNTPNASASAPRDDGPSPTAKITLFERLCVLNAELAKWIGELELTWRLLARLGALLSVTGATAIAVIRLFGGA
jgi:CHASE1-domain containing sensor protein